MKIVSTGRTISTTEYLAKKIQARRKRLYVACGAFFVLLIAIVVALRLKSFQITTIAVEGVPGSGSSDVEEVAREFISGSYFWLVPKTSAFFYPRAGLEKELLRHFPRMNAAAASLEGLRILHIEGAERKPFALYCAEACYFLDETGFIFDTAPVFSDGVYFAYSTEDPMTNPLGSQFLPEVEFKSLAGFVIRLRSFGADARSLKISETDARITLAGGATILFARDAHVDALASGLESFLKSDPIKAESGFWQRLSILDMRTENKVFYTFR